jgi:peptidoglycan/LPS O-acetylase OafA/YrhL
MVYVIIVSFWWYFNRTGKLWRALNKNSYGVYIIHVIVIGVFGTLLLNLSLPALVKYLLLIVLTYSVSNGLVSVYRNLVQAMKSSRSNSSASAVELG